MLYKQPVSALVVLHDAAFNILLLERAQAPGFWQSVTGSLEAGETPFQAALREVAEETAYPARAEALCDWHLCSDYEIYPRWRHRYAPGVTRNTEHVFSLCLPAAWMPTLHPEEHRAWQWLPRQEAAALAFSPSNQSAILALPDYHARLAAKPIP